MAQTNGPKRHRTFQHMQAPVHSLKPVNSLGLISSDASLAFNLLLRITFSWVKSFIRLLAFTGQLSTKASRDFSSYKKNENYTNQRPFQSLPSSHTHNDYLF